MCTITRQTFEKSTWCMLVSRSIIEAIFLSACHMSRNAFFFTSIFHFESNFFCRYTHGRGNEALQNHQPSTEGERESTQVEEWQSVSVRIWTEVSTWYTSFFDHDAWSCSTIQWLINQGYELYWNGCVEQLCVKYARLSLPLNPHCSALSETMRLFIPALTCILGDLITRY